MQPPSRQLPTKVVKQFRGISQYRGITTVPMDHALNLLNVFVSMSGALEKIRIPTVLTQQANFPGGGAQNVIDTMFDYQKSDGTRQLVFNAGTCIGFYVANVNANGVEIVPYAFNVIEDDNPDDNSRWSWISSNNVLYGANGKVMRKWDGAHWYQTGIGSFGISPPAPTLGVAVPIRSIQRAANVVTIQIAAANAATINQAAGYDQHQLQNLGVIGLPIKVSGVQGDPTMNGNFVTVTAGASLYTAKYSSVGANSGPFLGDGFITVYYQIQAEPTNFNEYTIGSASRINGVATIAGAFSFNILPGENVVISGLTGAYASFNGTQKAATVGGFSGGNFTFPQPGLPDVPAGVAGVGVVACGITDIITGRTWRYAYANSILGLVGPASDPSTPIPGGGLLASIRSYLTAPPPNDPQVDTIWWFGTQDGGGDYGLVLTAPIAPNGQPNVLGDARDDSLLDLTQLAPLINFAPPIGSRMAKFQGRIFLGGITDSPQDIAYSGYEQVLVGTRPEECWFPNNRLRLATGADDIHGFGVITPGVVAFSHSNQMFMFQGQVEDITTDQPVNFSAVLQELPWQTGTASHAAIQSTPYGIVWVGSDLTVKIWNGIFYGTIIGPRDLSQNIYPLMRRVTPGTAGTIQSAFFNFVERDWYAINLCLDGSNTPNYLVFFDLAQDANDNLGVFIANLKADCLTVREDNNGGRHMVISSGGVVYELMVQSQQTNGIVQNVSATDGQLVAYWESGYTGSDSPMMVKMFRYGRIITDQQGFGLIAKVVDDENYTFRNPLVKALKIKGSKFKVGRKGRRSNLTIIFPTQDVSASVIELSYSSIPTGER